MSAEFDLALIGAQLQLCLLSSTIVCSHLFTTALLAVSCMILCFYRQTESCVPDCFDAFEIQKDLFWSRVFWGFSHKTTNFLSLLVSERGTHLILL
ncbi:hypothetical protein CRYUN_Cryun21dG0004900 [Craigia yunnanensis]